MALEKKIVSPSLIDGLGDAESILALRYRILAQFRERSSWPETTFSDIAACLNLITDANELRAVEARLLAIGQDERALESLANIVRRHSDLFSWQEVQAKEGTGPAGLSHSALQRLSLLDDPCVLRHRLEQALTLINEGCAILGLLDGDAVLERAVNVACQLVSGDVSLVLLANNGKWQNLHTCGISITAEEIPAELHAFLDSVLAGEPLIIDDVRSLLTNVEFLPAHLSIRQAVGVTFRQNTVTQGVLLVGFAAGKTVEPSDVNMLTAFARQISIALENLAFHAQARELSQLQERQRIAQDMHDTVVQLLFVIGMETESLLALLPDDSKAREKAFRVRRLASQATAELRLAISALTVRPTIGNSSLPILLQEAIEEWERLSGIEVTLVGPSEWPNMSPAISHTIYRIVHESLINIQKHAHASAVIVSVTVRPDKLVISIQDNGVGFPLTQKIIVGNSLHFGLYLMSQLAEHAGGYLEVLNGEDGGAVVRLVLPVG